MALASLRRDAVLLLLGIAWLITLAQCQDHGDTNAAVHCYNCRGSSGAQAFAQCLGVKPTACSPGQGCRMTYTTDWHDMPTIGCSSLCFFGDKPTTACPLGGLQTGTGKCDMCCQDDACVQRAKTTLLSDALVVCPSSCTLNHAQDCWENVQLCKANQFCEVTVERHRTIQGQCKDLLPNYQSCRANKQRNACPADVMSAHLAFVRSDCTVDCCTDNKCLGQLFGGVYSTFMASSTLPPPTTVATTETTTAATTIGPYSVYAQLQKECRDHLEPGACDTLKASQDLCRQNGTGLHIDLCPETCGVCQAITEANCHDTVLDGECAQLIADKDICHEPLAIYTCAASCGLCDILVEQKLAAILAGKLNPPSSTSAPTAATTKTTTTSTTTPTTTGTMPPTTGTRVMTSTTTPSPPVSTTPTPLPTAADTNSTVTSDLPDV